MKRMLLGAVALATLGAASAAHAQGTARSMDIDVSIRSAALGGASNALFWGQGVDHWGNPALLAYSRGIRYERGRTQLIPELADDIQFETDVLKVGVPGLGVVFSGTPFPEGLKLSYGLIEGTDQSGNPTGTYEAFETVESWGFGVSPLRIVEGAMRFSGTEPPEGFSRFDVSFGMNFKDVVVQFAPGFAGETSAQDWGVLARATPVDFSSRNGLPVRLDLAYGHSVLSYNDDAVITFLNEDLATPVSRHRRDGIGVRVAFDAPGLHDVDEGSPMAWFLEGLSPLVSIGVAADWSNISAGGLDEGYDVSGRGIEIELANIVALRGGQYRDRLGDIDGDSWGFGVGLPIGKVAGVRYEESWFPQADDSGLAHLERKGFSAWFDPVAAWQAMRHAQGRMAHAER